MKAVWNNTIIAQSQDTVVVEGNHYFSPESVHQEYLTKSGDTYTCHWKGICDYYDITVEGVTNKKAAWIYPNPTEAARPIKGRFAFWRGVKIIP